MNKELEDRLNDIPDITRLFDMAAEIYKALINIEKRLKILEIKVNGPIFGNPN